MLTKALDHRRTFDVTRLLLHAPGVFIHGLRPDSPIPLRQFVLELTWSLEYSM